MHHELLKEAKVLKTTYDQADIITWKDDLRKIISSLEKKLEDEK